MNITQLFNETNKSNSTFPEGYNLIMSRIGWYKWVSGDKESIESENYWEVYHQAKCHYNWNL